MPAPGYSAYVAPEKYAQRGRVVFGGRSPVEARSQALRWCRGAAGPVVDAADAGRARVSQEEFDAALPELAMTAFADLSNRTNPRMPLVTELTALLRAGYDGRNPDAH
jgi:acetaldehyde dehydrogenase/alcohol dehydrogenase